jgi:hypothetical protein
MRERGENREQRAKHFDLNIIAFREQQLISLYSKKKKGKRKKSRGRSRRVLKKKSLQGEQRIKENSGPSKL